MLWNWWIKRHWFVPVQQLCLILFFLFQWGFFQFKKNKKKEKKKAVLYLWLRQRNWMLVLFSGESQIGPDELLQFFFFFMSFGVWKYLPRVYICCCLVVIEWVVNYGDRNARWLHAFWQIELWGGLLCTADQGFFVFLCKISLKG